MLSEAALKAAKPSLAPQHIEALTNYIQRSISGSTKQEMEANLDGQLVYILPFKEVTYFGNFFLQLEKDLRKLQISSFGVSLPSLEDVFLKVGSDHTVTPTSTDTGIGSERKYQPSFISQVIGLIFRKLTNSRHDFTTLPLLGLPAAAGIVAAIIYGQQIVSEADFLNSLISIGIYVGKNIFMIVFCYYIVFPGKLL